MIVLVVSTGEPRTVVIVASLSNFSAPSIVNATLPHLA